MTYGGQSGSGTYSLGSFRRWASAGARRGLVLYGQLQGTDRKLSKKTYCTQIGQTAEFMNSEGKRPELVDSAIFVNLLDPAFYVIL